MHALNTIQNVLFDLDGTLVDSSRTILESVRHALETLEMDPAAGPGIEMLIGMPLLDIFTGAYGMPRNQAMQAIDIYRDHYDRLNQTGTRVYAGVRDGLAGLRGGGFSLYVATVKPTPIAEKVLSDLELMQHFDGVAGASMGPERRDKSSIIAWALSEFGLDASASVMVGDRDQDIEGARENGLESVAVSWGFGHSDELEQAAPDHHVVRFGDIEALLRERR